MTPAQGAMIWYPYGPSYDFPQVGSGGRTAMAGPVYYGKAGGSPRALPKYYTGKLFVYDWVRGWIKAVTMDKSGNFYKMEPFMPKTTFNAPVDMEVGPDGRLYVLEYGKGWYSGNPDAALSLIEYDTAGTVASMATGATPVNKTAVPPGLALIKGSDCLTCHKKKEKSVGPSYAAVAEKYSLHDADYLINKILNGGGGVWGNVPMPAHPTLSTTDARKMVDYIMTLK